MTENNLIKKRQIQISEEMLEYLLEYRKNNPDFTLPLRKRDSPQSKDKRLKEGLWFQGGSNYIFVPLFKIADNERKSKTIGFILRFNKDGSLKNNAISISFKSGVNTIEEINFHKELAAEIGLTLNDENHGEKQYPNPNNYLENLKDYIEIFRPKAINLLGKYNILDKYLVPKNEFDKYLNSTLNKRENLGKKENFSSSINNMKHPLNQILYGPPGTGKTYHTINKALEILGEDTQGKNRKSIKDLFDAKVAEGQIVFTTFHQSMSYEDFIEGIKPLKPDESEGIVKYDVVDGIFKILCRKAETPENLSFENAYQKLLLDLDVKDEIEVRNANFSYKIKSSENGEDLRVLSDRNLKNITKVGLAYVSKSHRYLGTWGKHYKALFQLLKENYGYNESVNSELKNHVLIIDEINRGNVSSIFGELITLIEEDKRLGMDESLEVTLPYSKAKFGVPSNLYIIGTMNTADRSVEALDAALRRRFSFEEMAPSPSLIATEGKLKNGFLNSINLPIVLETINRRIEKLLDKDHLIGHSYFMNVSTLSDLKVAFQNKIIPLLQEYFFGDYGKIGLVLGKDFFQPIDNTRDKIFADFDDYDSSEFSERVIYKLMNVTQMEDVKFTEAIQTLMG